MNHNSNTALEILGRLRSKYPEPATALSWETPWQLLAATMLSAQCTDKQVNKVTPVLFNSWPDPASLSQADPEQLQEIIRPVGFFRTKARNLLDTANILVRDFRGQVPASMEELLLLPGVARKTANIVLYNAFGLNLGIAVDTHVQRISLRLGLTRAGSPGSLEQDLMKIFPSQEWGALNHMLVWFGREVCRAIKPMCARCFLADICPMGIELSSNINATTHHV